MPLGTLEGSGHSGVVDSTGDSGHGLALQMYQIRCHTCFDAHWT